MLPSQTQAGFADTEKQSCLPNINEKITPTMVVILPRKFIDFTNDYLPTK